jgi:flagellar hook-basal body complex protein FliE
MAINPINIGGIAAPSVTRAAPAKPAAGNDLPFADMVSNLIKDTSQQQGAVDQSLEQLITGKSDSIHDVVLAASRADLSFRLVMEIRNRLISSYQEIMRMQV